MKSIIFSAYIATAIVACLTINAEAKPSSTLSATVKTIAVADTGKMGKMKKDKMKMSKMKKDSMKMSKKMDKMKMSKKDTTHKM